MGAQAIAKCRTDFRRSRRATSVVAPQKSWPIEQRNGNLKVMGPIVQRVKRKSEVIVV